jgi:hypothetical protein
MHRLALLSIAAATLVGFVAGAGAERAPVESCAQMPGPTSATPTAAPSEPFLGMLMRLDTSVFVARLDPLSLKPVSSQVALGEYHDTWSLSPDRSQVAFGISAPGRLARIGIVVVDLKAMRVVRKVETGIAAEAIGWLAPRLLVAGLQRDGAVLVDPRTGAILRRWPGLSDPQASARARDGVVMLLPGQLPPGAEGSAAARLAFIDTQGRLRSVALERIRLAFRNGVQWDRAGLAIDRTRARAYVFAADAPVAEVDLRTMRVSYHRLEPLFLKPGELKGSEIGPDDELSWRYRDALWLGDGRVLVVGHEVVRPAGGGDVEAVAAGAMLVNTAAWSSCVLDAKAAGAALVAGRVLVYGRRDLASLGLRAYTVHGRKAFHLLDDEHVSGVQVAGHHAYVHRVIAVSPRGGTRSAVYVVDARSGRVLNEIALRGELVDVVAGPP